MTMSGGGGRDSESAIDNELEYLRNRVKVSISAWPHSLGFSDSIDL